MKTKNLLCAAAAAFLLAPSATAEPPRLLIAEMPAVETVSGPVDVRAEVRETFIGVGGGEPDASVVSFGYFLDQDDAADDRPIVFFWNGGPGASAALLHTGFAAPMRGRAALGQDAPADGGIEPNPLTLIDVADLVYVDPPGTGFSRGLATDEAEFWGVVPDAAAMAAFVEGFMKTHGRGGDPVYLCGESYGGVRIAAMAAVLTETDVNLAGLIMISPAIDSAVLRSGPSPVAASDMLASIAAIGLDKGWLASGDPGALIEEAYAFAAGPYKDARRDIDSLGNAEKARLAERIERFTGQPAEVSLQNGLRLSYQELSENLGIDIRRLDRHDARFVTRNGSLGGVSRVALGTGVKSLLDEVWGLDTGGEYRLMNSLANRRWTGPSGDTQIFSERFTISPMVALTGNRLAERGDGVGLRVLIASGRYDLVTPFSTPRRIEAADAFAPAELTLAEYDAGHVIYADPAAHELFAADVRAWLGAGVGNPID